MNVNPTAVGLITNASALTAAQFEKRLNERA